MQITYSPHPVELTELTFEALRAYRAALRDEEDRVSYWRRIVQGKLDMLGSGLYSDSPDDLNMQQVVDALGTTGTGANRVSLMRVAHTDPFPELPALTTIWGNLADTANAERAADELTEAEHALSEYRSHVHERLNAATAELIARYRSEPKLALTLLDL